MQIKKINLSFLAIYTVGLTLVLIIPFLLPAKYYSDGNHIQQLIIELANASGSFQNTAYIYRLFGFEFLFSDWLVGIIIFSFSLTIIAYFIRKYSIKWDSLPLILLLIWTIPIAIFLGQYSKEFIALIVTGSLLYLGSTKRGLLLGLALVVLYATFFRIYWFLILAFFMVHWVLIRNQVSFFRYIILFLLAAIVIFYAGNYMTDQYFSDARFRINMYREGSPNAVTMLSNLLVNTSPITDIINTFYGWFMLLIPIHLFKTGGIHHIIFAIFQFINVILFISAVKAILRYWKIAWFTLNRQIMMRVQVAIAWCLSFTFVEGMFEPDFGSFLKHELVILPMFFMVIMYRYSYLRLK
jgi:hypothetical protein